MKTKFVLKTKVSPEIRDGLAIIRDGWRLIFSLKTKVFAEIRDGLATIRDGWRLIFSLKPKFLLKSVTAYNLGQNKMEQKCPLSPKSRMKVREGQNVPFSHH